MEAQLEQIREQQKDTWNRFSGGWRKWDDFTMTWLRPMGEEIIRALELRDGDMVLDVAAGTGEPQGRSGDREIGHAAGTRDNAHREPREAAGRGDAHAEREHRQPDADLCPGETAADILDFGQFKFVHVRSFEKHATLATEHAINLPQKAMGTNNVLLEPKPKQAFEA